jgi:hypothetical protein
LEPLSPWNNLVFLSLAARPQGAGMIEAVIERCAGIDVGKKFLVVCVMSGSLEAEPKTEIRKFGTIVAELEAPDEFNHILGEFLAQVDSGRWPMRDPRATGRSITWNEPEGGLL